MPVVAALLCGVIFGLGLLAAQMTNPAKVLNFLDIAGAWDPSLAFVMGAAVIVGAIGFAIARRREAPVLAAAFHWPQSSVIDRRLIGGAVIFGVGWGLGGLCPGPALAGLVFLDAPTLIFIAAMLGGMALARWAAGAAAR